MRSFPYHKQSNQKDCGPTCLKMIAQFYGKNFNPEQMKNISRINREGSSMLDINDAAKKIGLRARGFKVKPDILKDISLPAILHWDHQHFVVLFKIKDNIYHIADPATGILELNRSEFLNHWQGLQSCQQEEGIVLVFSISLLKKNIKKTA